MNAIDLNAVTKSFPAFELGPIDLGIRKGELLGIFGPPSSGKTSVLKIILGLLQQDGGEVALAGVSGSELGVSERGLSMVFQNLALFPHLSGAENITFPLREAGADAARIAERLEAVSRVLHVEHILHKKPGQMSGGERQRIALGRALAAESGAVLLDEPISALDARLREEMRLELKRLQREQGQTFVYVSHDEEEVMAIADRIAILIDGKIAQLGTPDEVYNTPATSAVAALVGSPPMNLIPGRVAEDGRSFQSDALKDPIALPRQVRAGPVTLGVRPEDVHEATGEADAIAIRIVSVEPLGSHSIVNATLAGEPLRIRSTRHVATRNDFATSVRFDVARLHLFDQNGDRL